MAGDGFVGWAKAAMALRTCTASTRHAHHELPWLARPAGADRHCDALAAFAHATFKYQQISFLPNEMWTTSPSSALSACLLFENLSNDPAGSFDEAEGPPCISTPTCMCIPSTPA